MPQGFKNSPAVFQRGMTLILEGLLGKICLVYVDDILIFGKTIEEHDRNFEEVKKRLDEYNLIENVDKRIFRETKVKFLGYEIECNIVKPACDRAQGIMNFPSPKTKKQLQRFLGLVNYDRMFIKNMASILKPLYSILSKERKFQWTENEERIFTEIKNKWSEDLRLHIPDPNGSFILECDASNTGIGAVLYENENPVAFISRNLSSAEMNYSITEREVLAALWAMEKLEYFLVGKHFKLISDHKAIVEIKKKVQFGSQRVQRWFERLERFQFEPIYKEGKEMILSDTLSRFHENSIELSIKERVMKIHEELHHRKNICKNLEEVGVKISSFECARILDECVICKKVDPKLGKSCKFWVTYDPGELLGFDLMQYTQKEIIIVAIDYFSRKVFARKLVNKEAGEILNFIDEVYRIFPFKSMISDNGKEFNNNQLKKWTDSRMIEHKFSVPYYHQGNGRVERANRTLRTALMKTKGSIKVKLKDVVDKYNNSYHRGIKMTPEEALLESNKEQVRSNAANYEKEFERKNISFEELREGQKVLIKNENRSKKNEHRFKEEGIVFKLLYGDV
jgi:hypothetical protein